MFLRACSLAWLLAAGCTSHIENASREGDEPDQLAHDAQVTRLDASLVALVDAAVSESESDAQVAQESWSLCDQLRTRAGLSAPDAGRIAWSTLVCETVDLDRFTRAPDVPYRSLLASSYDRASQREGESGWFANADSGHYLRDDGAEHVLMEANAPGVITRIWSANPSGRLRIYFDRAAEPAIDVDMADFFRGQLEGAPVLSFEAGLGQNSYLPLPYASYARVTSTAKGNLYYQVDYRAYADGTQIEPFTQDGLRALAPMWSALADYVADPSAALATLPTEIAALDAEHPERQFVVGPAVIRELSVRKFDPSDDRLRGTRMIVTVDGERAIDAPLGDLFGAGPGALRYHSLAADMRADVLTLRWPMPVRESLSVRIEGSPLFPIELQLRYSRGAPPSPRRFHARWTGTQTFSTKDAVDWTVLEVAGAGWYVGTLLNVDNPADFWWGEGDEKIFVDGEAFPSHFGTGTEDYFGQAWCSTALVATPWVGQTRADGPHNAGRVSNYRWHVPDAIPFTTGLRFRLEVLHWLHDVFGMPITEDAVAYWYADSTATVSADTLESSSFRVVPVESVATPALLPGASACKL
jgi:hypothetical protein